MTDNPQTEFVTAQHERENWCGDCKAWQLHTVLLMNNGRIVRICKMCFCETYNTPKPARTDGAQLELFG